MKRILLDGLMLILFVLIMCFQFLPKMAHEIMGVALLLGVVIHLVWNRSWFYNMHIFSGNTRQRLTTILNVLLILDFLAVMVTGVLISNHLFKGIISMELRRNIWVHQIHVALPYLFLVLTGLHIGLHGNGLWYRLKAKIGFNDAGGIYRRVWGGLALVMSCVGIYASFLNRVGDRLLMKHIFATEAISAGGIGFAVLLLGTITLYTVIGWGGLEIMQRRTKHSKSEIIAFVMRLSGGTSK